MSFNGVFGRALSENGIGSERYRLAYKERTHISKHVLDAKSDALYLDIGKFHRGVYRSAADLRYVAATNVTYDMLMSLYDANTSNAFVFRLYGFDEGARLIFNNYAESLRRMRPNLEARIIGLQSKQNCAYLKRAAAMLDDNGIKLVEADLFGGEVRHIAIDLKLGASHSILMDDRLYRPGELANMLTFEQFERGLRR